MSSDIYHYLFLIDRPFFNASLKNCYSYSYSLLNFHLRRMLRKCITIRGFSVFYFADFYLFFFCGFIWSITMFSRDGARRRRRSVFGLKSSNLVYYVDQGTRAANKGTQPFNLNLNRMSRRKKIREKMV